MPNTPTPVEIFCSYVHEDQAWLQRLETHLSVLRRQGLISLWHDRLIPPGTDRTRTIDRYLETASVILLLVSADFLASDYCYSIEMKRAIEREAEGSARIIPILVRSVDWQGTPFAYLQPLPTDAKPIETWENQETALADVAAGIRRVIVKELPQISTRAPRTALPAIWNIPYPRNPFFLGRDAELAEVRRHLQAGQATALSQPQAISGLGGIGKTQLALEYAYRYQQDYQAVLWARAESTEELVASYIALAKLLQLPEYDGKEEDIIVQAVKTWLQTHRGWLLILDNADELALLPDFLPPSMGGHMLLTTRAAATGRLAHRLEIETLLPEQGALFLLRRSALLAPNATLEQASAQEWQLAWQISEELGGLPLALDQAGAYLEETGTSLVSYWQIYQQHRADLLEQRRGLVADHPASVATTWSLSFRQIQEKSPSAADLLRLCAFLSPDAIPEEVLTASASLPGPVLAEVAGDSLRLDRAIEALRAYSLIRRDPKGKTLSIHRLVQVVLQDTMEEAERRSWAERVILLVNEAFPCPDHDTWPLCERLMSQAWTATQFIEQYQMSSVEAERLLEKMGYYLWDRGSYAEAEPLYQQLLCIREQHLGAEDPKVASALDHLADLYWRQGKYTQAEPLLLRALEISEQQLGPEHPQVASVLFGLATVNRCQGKYAQSEQLYLRELRICEQQFGPEHPQVVDPLNNLAAVYHDQRKYAEVEPLYLRALQISKQQLGSEHYKVGYSLLGLAGLYRNQGKYAEAEPLYQQTLRLWEQHFGSEHPEVGRVLPGLARLYHYQGKYAEAEPLYQRALRIWEERLVPGHPEVAFALDGLASLYCSLGKYAEAEPLYQRALRIWEQTFAQDVGLCGNL